MSICYELFVISNVVDQNVQSVFYIFPYLYLSIL